MNESLSTMSRAKEFSQAMCSLLLQASYPTQLNKTIENKQQRHKRKSDQDYRDQATKSMVRIKNGNALRNVCCVCPKSHILPIF